MWFFPGIIGIVFILLVSLGVSGSSINVYDKILQYAPGESSLIVGQPRTVRSDEWLVTTPFLVSQSRNDFATVNPDIANGQDMSVVVDVPYREWSVIFKPQNLGFFFLPLANALAFKWWFLAAILLIGVYSFVLLLMPGKHLFASMLAVFMLMNPFTQWWYQSITLLPIAYSLLGVVLACKIIMLQRTRSKILLSLLLYYVLSCFVFVMYPPFQIICAGIALVLFIAILKNLKEPIKKVLCSKTFILVLLSSLAALASFALFAHQHRDVVQTIQNTVYPGNRTVPAGGMPIAEALSWPINYIVPGEGAITSFRNNQSEVSSYLFIGIFLIPVLIYHYFRSMRDDKKVPRRDIWIFGAMLSILIGICLRAFAPIGNSLYDVLQLDGLLAQRLWIGIGIINLVLIALVLNLPSKRLSSAKDLLSIQSLATGLFSFVAVLSALLFVKSVYALERVGNLEVLAVSLFIAAIAALLVHQIIWARYIGMSLLLFYALFTSLTVNPVYKGLGALADSRLTQSIEEIAKTDDSRWLATRSVLSPFIIAGGANSLSGVETYPQTKLWQKYFSGHEQVYNRYAHVVFSLDDTVQHPSIELIQADSYRITLSSCDSLLKQERVNYILDDSGSDFQCFQKYRTYMAGDTSIQVLRRVTP